MTEVLYLSYDGMTDPLGQSQVIPYLAGLSRKGYHFHLISFEKKAPFDKEQKHIAQLLKQHQIEWHPLPYTKKPPIISTMRDLMRMKKTAEKIITKHDVKIVHCRSYISGLAGLALKRKLGIRFLFDMRGFWADERVEGKIWNLENPLYKAVYSYFKKREKEMLLGADAIVTLTENGKKIIDSWEIKNNSNLPVSVIPCCADLNHFNSGGVNAAMKSKFSKQLELENGNPVLSYLGAIGTWYMLDEMFDFFKELLNKYPKAIFLFITHETADTIKTAASKKQIPESQIRIISASRNEVPTILSLSDVSIFFIRPTFSKRASSPTKQGEIMGMGIPIICNSGVGDTDLVIEKYNAGMVIDLKDPNSMKNAVNHFENLKSLNAGKIIQGAEEFYSLESGVEKYNTIYKKLIS